MKSFNSLIFYVVFSSLTTFGVWLSTPEPFAVSAAVGMLVLTMIFCLVFGNALSLQDLVKKEEEREKREKEEEEKKFKTKGERV